MVLSFGTGNLCLLACAVAVVAMSMYRVCKHVYLLLQNIVIEVNVGSTVLSFSFLNKGSCGCMVHNFTAWKLCNLGFCIVFTCICVLKWPLFVDYFCRPQWKVCNFHLSFHHVSQLFNTFSNYHCPRCSQFSFHCPFRNDG